MSMSEFERRRRRAALEQFNAAQTQLEQKNEQDETKLVSDHQKAALQHAAKLTGRFARTVAAAARTGIDQAQHKAEAIKAGRAQKRAEQEVSKPEVKAQESRQGESEINQTLCPVIDPSERSTIEETKAMVEGRSRLKPVILASIALVLILSVGGAWFLMHQERAAEPDPSQESALGPKLSAPPSVIHEAPKSPDTVQVTEPIQQVVETSAPSAVEDQNWVEGPRPKPLKAPPSSSVFPKKRSEPKVKPDAPGKRQSDWVDKASDDLDQFSKQLK
jgi:hypothetical protein